MDNNNVPDPNSKYKVIKLLGEGSYGKAYLVKQQADQVDYVIKTINVTSMSEKEQSETEEEAKILEKMDHPNIIKFHEVYRTKKTLNIVTEYADGGDLGQKIKSQPKSKPFNENDILDYFTQMCLAIKHIHNKHIIHRDLKSQNIFLTKNGLVKIGDFGIAKRFEFTWQKAMTLIGTPYYLSPEIVENKGYSYKSDIWSLGVLLYELMALKMPFDANSLPMLSMKIMKGAFSPLPGVFSKDLRLLVTSMLNVDPNKRPSTSDILKQPIIKSRIMHFLNEVEYNKEFSKSIVKIYKNNIKQKKPPNIPTPSTTNSETHSKSNSNNDLITNNATKKNNANREEKSQQSSSYQPQPQPKVQYVQSVRKKEEKVNNPNQEPNIRRLPSNSVGDSNSNNNKNYSDTRSNNKEPDIRYFIKKRREELKKKTENNDDIWMGKNPINYGNNDDKPSNFPDLIFIDKPSSKPQSTKSIFPAEQDDPKDVEDEYNANRYLNNLHQLITEGQEDSDNEGADESKTTDSSAKVDEKIKHQDFELDTQQQSQVKDEVEKKKESEPLPNYTSEYSQIEEMRIVLENTLGIQLFKPLYHYVDSTFDPNLFKCDLDKIKEHLKVDLSSKNYVQTDIDRAIDNIPEVFAIVVKDRTSNMVSLNTP